MRDRRAMCIVIPMTTTTTPATRPAWLTVRDNADGTADVIRYAGRRVSARNTYRTHEAAEQAADRIAAALAPTTHLREVDGLAACATSKVEQPTTDDPAQVTCRHCRAL